MLKVVRRKVRSLRYFTIVHDLQKQTDRNLEVSCPGCGGIKIAIDEVEVLSTCGHMGWLQCVKSCAEKEGMRVCSFWSMQVCSCVLNIVKADTSGVDDEVRDRKERHFGMKLEKVVHSIK